MVQAAPITDTVTIGSQEWAQVNLFTNLSWNTINAACPSGVCSSGSTLTSNSITWDMEGWTWASVEDVGSLFSTLIPPFTFSGVVGSASEANSSWGPAFLNDYFNPTFSYSYVKAIHGWTSTTSSSGLYAYKPYVSDLTDPLGKDVASTGYSTSISFMSFDSGAWFYRAAGTEETVPEPASVILLAIGLTVLGIQRRRRSSQT